MNIREIAKLANVSVTTVSKVINKKDASISAETREKILQIVKEYNYSPYANLRTPARGTTLLIGVLMNRKRTQDKKLIGILNQIHAEGYHAVVCAATSPEEEAKNIHVLSSYNVDGVIWDKTLAEDGSNEKLLEQMGLRYVTLGYDKSDSGSFAFDYKQLGKLCAGYVHEANHSQCLCLLPDASARSKSFAEGFRRAMGYLGLRSDGQTCQVLDDKLNLAALLCSHTAVVCLSAALADEVAKHADNLNLHIPRDLSIVCLDCDGAPTASFSRISTVQLPFEGLGRAAVASLIHDLEGRPGDKESSALPPTLNHRHSIDVPKTLRHKKIVVVGALNMDILMGLDEPPQNGEMISARSCVRMPGGKGLNQAVGATRLGTDTYLIGRIGKDYDGSVIYDFLKANHVNLDGVIFDPHEKTGNVYVHILENGETSLISYTGASDMLCAQDIRDKEALFENASYCLMQFLEKKGLAEQTVETAVKHNVKILLRPSNAKAAIDAEILRHIDILMPNRKQIDRLLPGSMTYEEKAQYYLDRGVKHVIITLGHRGCYFRDATHSMYFPAAKVVPVDTTGAADAFAATLVFYLSDGRDIVEAIRYATVAAGLSTTRQGVPNALADRETIELFLAKEEMPFETL